MGYNKFKDLLNFGKRKNQVNYPKDSKPNTRNYTQSGQENPQINFNLFKKQNTISKLQTILILMNKKHLRNLKQRFCVDPHNTAIFFLLYQNYIFYHEDPKIQTN